MALAFSRSPALHQSFHSQLDFYSDQEALPSYASFSVICTSEAEASERGRI